MPYIHLTTTRKLTLISAGIACFTTVLAITLALYVKELKGSLVNIGGIVIVTSLKINTLVIVAVALALLPAAVVDFLNRRYLDAIDRELGAFFSGLSEAVGAGMTMSQALEYVSKSIHGPLASEIKRVLTQIELGSTLEQALNDMVERLKLPSLRRAAVILITAHESGGRLVDVLSSAAESFLMLRAYEEERRTIIAPYFWTVYVALLVYIFVSFVLIYAFFKPLAVMSAQGALLGLGKVNVEVYRTLLLYSSALEGLFGGLIAGKLKTGKASAGLIHSVIMLFVVIAAFNVMEPIGTLIELTSLKP